MEEPFVVFIEFLDLTLKITFTCLPLGFLAPKCLQVARETSRDLFQISLLLLGFERFLPHVCHFVLESLVVGEVIVLNLSFQAAELLFHVRLLALESSHLRVKLLRKDLLVFLRLLEVNRQLLSLVR